MFYTNPRREIEDHPKRQTKKKFSTVLNSTVPKLWSNVSFLERSVSFILTLFVTAILLLIFDLISEILRLREHEQLTARAITIEYWYSQGSKSVSIFKQTVYCIFNQFVWGRISNSQNSSSHRGVHRRPANCHYHGKILRKSENSDVALRTGCRKSYDKIWLH